MFLTSISTTTIVEGIAIFYVLKDAVSENLELSCATFIGDMGNKKEVKLVAVADFF